MEAWGWTEPSLRSKEWLTREHRHLGHVPQERTATAGTASHFLVLECKRELTKTGQRDSWCSSTSRRRQGLGCMGVHSAICCCFCTTVLPSPLSLWPLGAPFACLHFPLPSPFQTCPILSSPLLGLDTPQRVCSAPHLRPFALTNENDGHHPWLYWSGDILVLPAAAACFPSHPLSLISRHHTVSEITSENSSFAPRNPLVSKHLCWSVPAAGLLFSLTPSPFSPSTSLLFMQFVCIQLSAPASLRQASFCKCARLLAAWSIQHEQNPSPERTQSLSRSLSQPP